jgi:hypothetical protein
MRRAFGAGLQDAEITPPVRTFLCAGETRMSVVDLTYGPIRGRSGGEGNSANIRHLRVSILNRCINQPQTPKLSLKAVHRWTDKYSSVLREIDV